MARPWFIIAAAIGEVFRSKHQKCAEGRLSRYENKHALALDLEGPWSFDQSHEAMGRLPKLVPIYPVLRANFSGGHRFILSLEVNHLPVPCGPSHVKLLTKLGELSEELALLRGSGLICLRTQDEPLKASSIQP